MKKLFIMMLLIAVVLCTGCGGDKEMIVVDGTKVVDLPPGEKFVNFAPKNYYHHYIIHRKRHADEKAEEYEIDEFNGSDLTSRYIVVREH